MLLTRTTMLETLREDYIMAARAKGLPEKTVRDKHAARNAMLPVFSSFIIGLPFITNDIPLIMGTWLFIGILSLSAHLVADIAYVFIDPRIRYA